MTYRIIELTKGKHYEIVIEAGKSALTGQRKRIVRRVKGRKLDAEDYCRELLQQLKHGNYIKPKSITLASYLRQWLSDHSFNLAPSTSATYRAIIDNHILPELGGITLTNLEPAQIQKYYKDKLTTLSPRSVQQHHSVLRKALKNAVQWKLINNNPTDNLIVPIPKHRTIYTLTIEQLDDLLSGINSDLKPLFVIAAYTGMRLGELLALRWKDVDLETPSVNITRSMTRVNREHVFKSPKSRYSVRQVLLPKAAAGAFGSIRIDGELVFSRNGEPLNPSVVSRTFKRFAALAGHDMRFHDLRHTHATILLSAGVHPKVVQERLGHADITITLNTYSHVTKGLQEEAVRIINGQRNGRDTISE